MLIFSFNCFTKIVELEANRLEPRSGSTHN